MEFEAHLAQLGISEGDSLFAHVSYSRVRHLVNSPEELIERLLTHVGPRGNVVMASYTWNCVAGERPWVGYNDFFNSPRVFDHVYSQTNMGIVPETFRNFPGVRRSTHPWWSLCVFGPEAESITAFRGDVDHPFDEHSAYRQLASMNVKVLGIGVTLNTSSLCLLVDYELGKDFVPRVFTDKPKEVVVVDARGQRRVVGSYTILPQVVKAIKPSGVFRSRSELSRHTSHFRQDDTIFFSYPFQAYEQQAMALGRKALEVGKCEPWLEAVEFG